MVLSQRRNFFFSAFMVCLVLICFFFTLGHAAPSQNSSSAVSLLKNESRLSSTALIAAAVEQEGPGITYTLEESVVQALAANHQIDAAAYRVFGANARVGEARGRMLPTVTLSAGRNYVNSIRSSGQVDIDAIDQHTDSASLQLIQPLFSGLSVLRSYQKAQLNEELTEAEKHVLENEIVLDVQITFLDLLKSRGDVRALQGALERLEESVKAVRAFADVRMAPYVDVLQAEADLADTAQKLSQARNEVATLGIRLNTLLGLHPRAQTTYAGDFQDLRLGIPWSLEECLERARANRPDLVVASKALAMARKEAKIVYGDFWPKVDLSGSYVYQDRDFDKGGIDSFGREVDRDYETEYWTASVNLEWRLAEGGSKHYAYQRARSEIGRLRAGLRNTENQVLAEARTQYLTLKEARERIATARGALGEAKESHERAQVRFEARVGTIIELLDAQARLTRAETNLSQAQADYQKALARLLFAIGERDADLSL